MKNILTVFLLLLFHLSLAQFNDDFSDGDFANNPQWVGSTSEFTINPSHQLQLNNAGAATSYLYTPLTMTFTDHFEWHVYVKQSFAGSANNYGRIYLMSDQADLTGSLNGYYLQFGESGSNDAIELFQQTGLTSASVCRASNGSIASSFALRLKVIRNAPGSWELYVDYNGGMDFVLEGNGVDATYGSSSFFGIRCTYTASNSTNFYYDDFIVSEEGFVDNIPPVLENVTVNSSTELTVHFDEDLDPVSAGNPENYLVEDIGNPLTAALQPDNKSVFLSFSTSFQNGVVHLLTVNSIEDLNNNALSITQLEFLFFEPVPEEIRDMIFTEIFADPSPQIALPDAEFIEIHNRSTNPFDLLGWKISDGSSIATLPAQIILPGEYWVVTASANVPEFDPSIKTIGVSNFPTLNNNGDILTLRSATGLLIDSLSYTLEWYHDEDKQEGGWTLELINPNDICAEALNWSASTDPSGGTPGKVNSIFSDTPDMAGPKLLSVSVESEIELKLSFDENLNMNAAFNAGVTLSPMIAVDQISFTSSQLNELTVMLASPLQKQLLYSIVVTGVTDCPGNPIQTGFDHAEFYFLENVDVNYKEIIFTEIHSDPEPVVGLPNAEYIEIFNRTEKPFDLAGWRLADATSSAMLPTFVLLPGHYLLLTAAGNVSGFSPNLDLLGIANFPSLNNDGEILTLKSPQGDLVDSLNFNLSWYRDQVKEEGGWSLELIDPENICGEADNWAASEADVGGTPGIQNSIFANKPDLTGPKLLAVAALNDLEILLFFDEKLEKETPQHMLITINPEAEPGDVQFETPALTSMIVSFFQPLMKQQLYTIEIDEVYDCSGNALQEEFSEAEFALPEVAASGDIIINEILFNPRPNGVDFVELFNTSPKYISLKDARISNYLNMVAGNQTTITDSDLIMAPQQYLVLTPDPEILASEYPKGRTETFHKVSLPGLPDDQGSVAILNQDEEAIDYLIYDKAHHSALLRDDEGVSLEKINMEIGGNEANWKSATAASGFATPGFQNSNYSTSAILTQGDVVVNPEVFAPASGSNDFAQIQFWFDQPGLSANIKIFDQQGRLIRTLANNEVIGTQGFFRWDGDQDDGTKARMGYYFVWFEVFSLDGLVNTFRKRVVVSSR